ncbi:MAG: glutaredoxin family protein [Acidimicrobiia bacterium]
MSTFSIRFLTRRGCHLCDDARPVVMAVARRLAIEVVEVDIDTDDELVGNYGLRIPVVLGPGDEVLAEGVIERGALRRSVREVG